MKTIKGPALFLAQFAGDAAPFNSWDSITKWAADVGYVGVQVPTWDGRLFDLKKQRHRKPIAMIWLARRGKTALKSPNCPPTFRDSLLRFIQHMMKPSMALQHRKCAETPRHVRNGPLIR